MALTVKAAFVVAGVQVGNIISGSIPVSGAKTTIVLFGSPSISVAQAQTAKLRVWVTDGDGGTGASVFEIGAPSIGFSMGGERGLDLTLRGPVGTRNRRPSP